MIVVYSVRDKRGEGAVSGWDRGRRGETGTERRYMYRGGTGTQRRCGHPEVVTPEAVQRSLGVTFMGRTDPGPLLKDWECLSPVHTALLT